MGAPEQTTPSLPPASTYVDNPFLARGAGDLGFWLEAPTMATLKPAPKSKKATDAEWGWIDDSMMAQQSGDQAAKPGQPEASQAAEPKLTIYNAKDILPAAK